MEEQPIDSLPLSESELGIELMGHLYEFFQKIHHKKGFTFTKDVRVQQLRGDNGWINWSINQKQFTYDRNREDKKIQKVVEDNNLFPNKKEKQVFGQVVLFASCLFDQESTSEFYKVMSQVWGITSKNIHQNEARALEIANLSQRVSENFNQLYPFFSFNFSAHYNVEKQLLKRQLHQLFWRTSQSFSLVMEWCRTNSEQ